MIRTSVYLTLETIVAGHEAIIAEIRDKLSITIHHPYCVGVLEYDGVGNVMLHVAGFNDEKKREHFVNTSTFTQFNNYTVFNLVELLETLAIPPLNVEQTGGRSG